MAQHYIAVPQDHTVIHLSLLHVITYTMKVYNRLTATGHANLVQQAVMGFPSTPETSNKKGPIPCKTEVKTENPNRTSSSPKPPPESIRRSHANKRVFFLENAAKTRNAFPSKKAANARNITKTHQKPSEPNPISTPTKSLSLAHRPSQIMSPSLAKLSAQIPLTQL